MFTSARHGLAVPAFLALLLVLLSLPATPHAMRACTQMGCHNGLHVMLEGGTWLPGRYAISIAADGKTITCQAVLPFADCDSAHVTCSAPGVQIGESGCALPASEHSLNGFMMAEVPRRIEFSIRHESGKRFAFTQTLNATTVQPNGQGCEPVCRQATLRKNVVFN